MVIREGVRDRLAESINLAVRHGDGLVLATYEEKTADGGVWHDRLFSTQYACPNCKISYEELEPRTFSFNSPYGACPTCEGLGVRVAFDPELVVPDASSRWPAGRSRPGEDATPAALRKHQNHLREFLAKAGIPLEHAAGEASPKFREQLLHGDGKGFPGVLGDAGKGIRHDANEAKRQRLEAFRGEVLLQGVRRHGCGPRPARCTLAGKAIHEVTALTVGDARAFFAATARSTRGRQADRRSRFSARSSRGWSFSTASDWTTSRSDRPADTLSGGELQRVRLATGLGSGLVGVCYVLDEPSIGLHPRDNQRLIDALRELQTRGNTVVVVEHDETIMRRADWLVDLGPGAGRHGGRIVAQGTPEPRRRRSRSRSPAATWPAERIPVPPSRRRGGQEPRASRSKASRPTTSRTSPCSFRSRHWCA